jgi:hypothetical protein
MSKRRKVKYCQRRYDRGMCGRKLPRMSTEKYCPWCKAKLESIAEREKYSTKTLDTL